MKSKRTPEQERARVLSYLAKRGKAEIEWPCENPELLHLVEVGYAARVWTYISRWGGRNHQMSTITITEAGRLRLRETQHMIEELGA